MKAPITSFLSDLMLGFTGVSASIFAVITSWQEQMEWGMRIVSLSLGIIVGIITIVQIRSKM